MQRWYVIKNDLFSEHRSLIAKNLFDCVKDLISQPVIFQ